MALTGATLGKTAMIKGFNNTLVQNYRVGYFSPKDEKKLEKTFLYYTLIGEHVQNEILGFINAGAQGNIGKADFEKIKFSYPLKFDEQVLISKSLISIDEKIELEQQAMSKLQLIKSGLMQDLLSGKVEVSVSKEEEIVKA
jgi:type I restriction enzyme S subunit